MAAMTISQQLSSIISIVLVAVSSNLAGGSSIGVCYGMLGDNLPSPSEVISMYREHNIGKIRLYDPNPSALEALRGTGIEVLVGVRNEDIQELANSYSSAQAWVARNILSFWPDVNFRYISVGNEVIPGENAQHILSAMTNIFNALRPGDLWEHIKVSTSVSASVMGVSYPPSAASFSEATAQLMPPIADFLNSIGAPMLVNLYPYFSYIGDSTHISLDYATFTSTDVMVRDGAMSYYNLFDAMVDALHASLERAGAGAVPVVVSETGWPSEGNGAATTVELARQYNGNLVRHVAAAGGTPRWPGVAVEAYLFSMFNEDLKTGEAVERHWGLFNPNKLPVYPIKFL